jgi:hypothetical protein
MTLRWGIFFFVVAIVAALASLGAFGSAGTGEVAGQVGIAKIAFLGLLAIGAAGFVGWIVFLNQKQKRGSSDMPAERPWQPDDIHHLQPESDRDREPHLERATREDEEQQQQRAGRGRIGSERPSGLR